MTGHRESQVIAVHEAVAQVDGGLVVRMPLQVIQPAIAQRNDGAPAALGSGGVRHEDVAPMSVRGLALAVAATAATATGSQTTTATIKTCYHLLPCCDILTYYRYEHYY